MKLAKRILAAAAACAVALSFAAITAGADAVKGTPGFGTNDALWDTAPAIQVNDSTQPGQDNAASGVARILWDDSFLYVRVVVTDPDVFTGHTGSPWMDDNIEFFVGPGSMGSNQYRVGAGGDVTGLSPVDSKVTLTDNGYIVEAKFDKVGAWGEGSKVTFEVQIGNSSSAGGDRFEVITAFGTPDAGYTSDSSFVDSITLLAAPGGGAAADSGDTPAPSPRTGNVSAIAIVSVMALAGTAAVIAKKRK